MAENRLLVTGYFVVVSDHPFRQSPLRWVCQWKLS